MTARVLLPVAMALAAAMPVAHAQPASFLAPIAGMATTPPAGPATLADLP